MPLGHRRRCISSGRGSGSRRRTSPCCRRSCWRNHGHVLRRSLAHSLLFSWRGSSGRDHWSYRSESRSNWSHIGRWSNRTNRSWAWVHRLNRLLIRLLFWLLIRIENTRVMGWLRRHRSRHSGWRIRGWRRRIKIRLGSHAGWTS